MACPYRQSDRHLEDTVRIPHQLRASCSQGKGGGLGFSVPNSRMASESARGFCNRVRERKQAVGAVPC